MTHSPLFLSISLSLPLHLPLHPALLFINEAPCSYTAFPLHGKHAEHANPPKCTLLLADNRHCAFISYLRYDFKQLAETFGLYYECLLQDNNILGLLLLMFQSRAYYGYTTLLAVWVPGSLTLLICVCSQSSAVGLKCDVIKDVGVWMQLGLGLDHAT